MVRLQFVCGDDLSSDVIAWFSAGHFSHVDALLDDGRLLGARSDFVGGKPAGVQIRPADYSKWSRRVIFTLPATPQQEAAYLNFLYGQIGKPYDKTANMGIRLQSRLARAGQLDMQRATSRGSRIRGRGTAPLPRRQQGDTRRLGARGKRSAGQFLLGAAQPCGKRLQIGQSNVDGRLLGITDVVLVQSAVRC